MHKYMTVAMPDKSIWAVPVELIALDRAKHYAHLYGGDVEKSLKENTIPLFESDTDEIEDWAVNNMDWADFNGHQIKVSNPPPVDFQSGWIDGEKEFIDESNHIIEKDELKFLEELSKATAAGDANAEFILIARRYKELELKKANS